MSDDGKGERSDLNHGQVKQAKAMDVETRAGTTGELRRQRKRKGKMVLRWGDYDGGKRLTKETTRELEFAKN